MSGKSAGPSLRRHILPGLFVALLFYTLWDRRPDAAAPAPETLTYTGQTMGTTFSIKLGSLSEAQEGSGVADAIREELAVVVDSMSTYVDTSELSRWNRLETTEPVTISESLSTVVAAGLSISRQTGGAFDMTVQPLVDLWGFGPTQREEKPAPEKVSAALKTIGWEKVLHDPIQQKLGRQVPGVWLDLSAIAKGYAVDRLSERLTNLGYPNHFVEVGGEVRARGRKSDALPWRVGLEQPTGGRVRQLSFPLTDLAVATSGSYRNYRQYGDKVFSHTIDPRTGAPVEHKLISVSVVHDTCMLADAWATALAVLGPRKGLSLAATLGLSASFLSANADGETALVQTPAFKEVVNVAKMRSNER